MDTASSLASFQSRSDYKMSNYQQFSTSSKYLQFPGVPFASAACFIVTIDSENFTSDFATDESKWTTSSSPKHQLPCHVWNLCCKDMRKNILPFPEVFFSWKDSNQSWTGSNPPFPSALSGQFGLKLKEMRFFITSTKPNQFMKGSWWLQLGFHYLQADFSWSLFSYNNK